MPDVTPYSYNAYVVSVYDGDTITVILDMGMGVQKKAKCRMYGIDTPELRGKTAKEKARVVYVSVKTFLAVQKVQKKSPQKWGFVYLNERTRSQKGPQSNYQNVKVVFTRPPN